MRACIHTQSAHTCTRTHAHTCTRHTHARARKHPPRKASASQSDTLRLISRSSIEATNQVGKPGQGLSKGHERIKQTVLQVGRRVEYFGVAGSIFFLRALLQKRYERADCPDFVLYYRSVEEWNTSGNTRKKGTREPTALIFPCAVYVRPLGRVWLKVFILIMTSPTHSQVP